MADSKYIDLDQFYAIIIYKNYLLKSYRMNICHQWRLPLIFLLHARVFAVSYGNCHLT